MPWCPKCKTEYQAGITECADCKTPLVDELTDDLIPFFQAEDKRVADKLASFFQYSDLTAAVKYDEENDYYIVAIDPKKQLEAKKLYQAFYFVERERMLKGESDIFSSEQEEKQPEITDENESFMPEAANDTAKQAEESLTDEAPSPIIIEEVDETEAETEDISKQGDNLSSAVSEDKKETSASDKENSSTYIMKADQYKDLAGTVWIFMIFGIAGIIFVLLNITGILNILSGWLSNTIIAALFIFFIYVAISTNIRARKIKAEIAAEEKLTGQINDWLAGNITEDFLKQISDEGATYEVNYLKQVATIKEMLIKEFGSQNEAYLDRVIEDFYSRTFDKMSE